MAAQDPVDTYAETLKARRRRLGLTQQDLADLAGVSARSVHEVERGKATVRLDVLTAVATALGLELTLTLRGTTAPRDESR
ncbi:type II toxin-antitoxin system Y4mF family antitoxin [Microbacterium sp. 18062]|uniref:type II toxin-antitoxin system Y4mF family antitoxin n=1 Tax=Microbacterium sp. 18062 TaxID=2681410 RepID=UPI00135CAFAF|nr:type II toxin-antitoxin system Y4mF family antitoxin [Microbacterium sp. 18062]